MNLSKKSVTFMNNIKNGPQLPPKLVLELKKLGQPNIAVGFKDIVLMMHRVNYTQVDRLQYSIKNLTVNMPCGIPAFAEFIQAQIRGC
jgi:hypothetical protein